MARVNYLLFFAIIVTFIVEAPVVVFSYFNTYTVLTFINNDQIHGWGDIAINMNTNSIADDLVQIIISVTALGSNVLLIIPVSAIINTIIVYILLKRVTKIVLINNLKSSRKVVLSIMIIEILIIYVSSTLLSYQLQLWSLGRMFFILLQIMLIILLINMSRKIINISHIITMDILLLGLNLTYYVLAVSYASQLLFLVFIFLVTNIGSFKVIRLPKKQVIYLFYCFLISMVLFSLINLFMHPYILTMYVKDISYSRIYELVVSRLQQKSFSYVTYPITGNYFMTAIRVIVFRIMLVVLFVSWIYSIVLFKKENFFSTKKTLIAYLFSISAPAFTEVLLYSLAGYSIPLRTYVLLFSLVPLVLATYMFILHKNKQRIKRTILLKFGYVLIILFGVLGVLNSYLTTINLYNYANMINNSAFLEESSGFAHLIKLSDSFRIRILSDHYYSGFLTLKLYELMKNTNVVTNIYVYQLSETAELLANTNMLLKNIKLKDVNIIVIPKRYVSNHKYILISGTLWQGHIFIYNSEDLFVALNKCFFLNKIVSSGFAETYIMNNEF